MSGVTFTHAPCGPGGGRVRDASARLEGGHFLTVSAARYSDRVELSIHGGMLQSYMIFTAEQVRSVAAELLACADALQECGAAQGGA